MKLPSWNKRIWFVLLPIILVCLSSCGINSNLMLKTPTNFVYDSIPKQKDVEYRLAPNDIISFELYTNSAFKLLDMTTSEESGSARGVSAISLPIDQDSMCKFPTLGSLNLTGLTLREAEDSLEKRYAEYWKEPFVILKVMNRRVVMFPGNAGDAMVINLTSNNTTLMECLALAGGISDDGKAYKIKLIRNNDKGERSVFLIDLSKIDNLALGDIVMQSNDIVYVEPHKKVIRETAKELAPIISIISSTIVIITAINLVR